MKKRNAIIYWTSTLWLSLGMVSSGIVQIIQTKETVEELVKLGYPMYFFTLLGIWKILGVIAILSPKFPLVKEWAYAGFFFAMSGAIFSHIANADTLGEIFPPLLLISLTIISWSLRPADRKINYSTI